MRSILFVRDMPVLSVFLLRIVILRWVAFVIVIVRASRRAKGASDFWCSVVPVWYAPESGSRFCSLRTAYTTASKAQGLTVHLAVERRGKPE
jgi:hypothetical protein